MICPMMSSKDGNNDNYVQCTDGFCMWYNKEKGECCIKIIAENMALVAQGDRIIRVQEV